MSFFGAQSNAQSSLATGGAGGSFFDNLANGADSHASHHSADSIHVAFEQQYQTGGGPAPKALSPTRPGAWMQRPPPPLGTGSTATPVAYGSVSASPAPGLQRGASGALFPPPPPRRVGSNSSSQETSPTKAAPHLMRPPPRQTNSYPTLSPSGSVGSMTGLVNAAGGIASRYPLPPAAASMEQSATRLGAPRPAPPQAAAPLPPAVPTDNGTSASDSAGLNTSPAALGNRLSTLVNGERTKAGLQRLAPAASWLVAGASKIGSFVAGPDAGPVEHPQESVSSWDHTQPGMFTDAHTGVPATSAAPQFPAQGHDSPPVPLNHPHSVPQQTQWQPTHWGSAPPKVDSLAHKAPPSVEEVPEATSTVPLNPVPAFGNGSSRSASGAALATLADSSADYQPTDTSAMPDASMNGSQTSSWFAASPSTEELKASPQPLQRLAPAAKWLLAGAGKAAQFVTGVDGGPTEGQQGGSEDAMNQEPGLAPAGAYSEDLSTQSHSQSDPNLPAADVFPSQPAGNATSYPPAADTAAQEEHYAGVAALIAASDAHGEKASQSLDSNEPQGLGHRGKEWGFGSFFMKSGSRAPSFSTNLDSPVDKTAGTGRPPPPPVFTRSSASGVLGKDSPGTVNSEQGSTVIHPSPHGSPPRPPPGPSWGIRKAESSAQQPIASTELPEEAEGAGWTAQPSPSGQGWLAQSVSAPMQADTGNAAPEVPEQTVGSFSQGWLAGNAQSSNTGQEESFFSAYQGVSGQDNYNGFGVPATVKPLSPVTTHSKTDPVLDASPSGAGWLNGGVDDAVAQAEDVTVDAHGEVLYANTPRAADDCATPFQAGVIDTFAGGDSFFNDPSMAMGAAGAEALGQFFGASTTPRAADVSAADGPASFFDEQPSHTPCAGHTADSFFASSGDPSADVGLCHQNYVAEPEDVTVDAYGQLQYASTPTPHAATTGTVFGDTRPMEDSSGVGELPAQPEYVSKHVWGDSAGYTAEPANYASGEAAVTSSWNATEGVASSGDAGEVDGPDQQFTSILRSAGLHVRTEVDSSAPQPSVAASLPEYGVGEADDAGAVSATDSYASGLVTHPSDHVDPAVANATAELSSHVYDAPHSGAAEQGPLPAEAHQDEPQGVGQKFEANEGSADVVAPGMGALAGLAGMVGWAKKSHQGGAGHHLRSVSQQSQQLSDTTAQAPQDMNEGSTQDEAQNHDGLAAAFSSFMRDETEETDAVTHSYSPEPTHSRGNSVWSQTEPAAAPKPPLPPTTLPRPPPSSIPPIHNDYHESSGSLGSALLPPPPPNLRLGGEHHAAASFSNSSLPYESGASTLSDMYSKQQPYEVVRAPEQQQSADLRIASTTDMSEMRTSAESADALPATTDQAYNNLSDSIKPLIATGFNAPSADTSLQAEGQAAANTFLMGLQTASDSAQHAQIPDSSERTLDSNQELQVSREAQGSIPQIPALHPERSSVNGSESNLEKRYSSGTEYSMSKLPESSAALSGLAPGARPPVAPTPARSTPASSPRARTVSASGTNFKALQQYVADLESEKFELQRGLQRQMELVRKLADDHQDAENHLAACKAEAAELREELQKANASLMDKAQMAADAQQTAEAAKQAVQDVLDGRTLIVEENVALEEQVLELKNQVAAAQQHHSELESRVAAAGSDVKAVQAKADTAEKRAEQDRKRLLNDIEELLETRTTLLGRIRDMALEKGLAPVAAATNEIGAMAPAADVASRSADVGVNGAAVAWDKQVADAACQCSGASGDIEAARRALGRGLSGRRFDGSDHTILEDEVQELQDPASLRVAEQANAASRDAIATDQSRDHKVGDADLVTDGSAMALEGWRALLPPVGRGSGVVAAVADTQVGVLDSVHALLDKVAKERARDRQNIVHKTAEINLLKAAVLAAGGVLPQCGIWHDPNQPENGEADLGKDSQAVSSNAATSVVQKLSSAPEEPQTAAGQALHTRLASENGGDTVSDTNGVNGIHGRVQLAANSDEIEQISSALMEDPGTVAANRTPSKSIEQTVAKAAAVESTKTTPSPSRGWFGMFGRSPARNSSQPNLLNSA